MLLLVAIIDKLSIWFSHRVKSTTNVLERHAFRARLFSHDSACQTRYWASLVQLVNVHPLSVGLTNLVAAAAK